jgi:hypothetical protein
MDNVEHDADSEDLVGPDSSAELIAGAWERIKALEGTVREQVDQHINARLAEALAESARLSDVLRDTAKESASRREAAKRKASRWRADVRRPSGILGLFSISLREVTGHIDALADKAIRTSLMVDLAFLLHVAGSGGTHLAESEADELKALRRINSHRPQHATRATKNASAKINEIILNRAGPYSTDDGWEQGTPKKILPDVHKDIEKLNAENESLPPKRRPKPIKKLKVNTVTRRLARLTRMNVRPS